MILATSNIRNNPDLARDKVRHDLRVVRDTTRAGIIAWQEIGEREDHADIRRVLPIDHWRHTGGLTENVISLRSRFEVLDEIITRTHGGRAKVSPARSVTEVLVRVKDRPELPPFVVMGTHAVSGAFSHPGQLGDADGWRRDMWRRHHGVMSDRVGYWVDRHASVFHAGDWNRTTGVDPFGGRWLAQHGYDKIGFVRAAGGVGFERRASGVVSTRELFTDHAAVWVRGTLTRP